MQSLIDTFGDVVMLMGFISLVFYVPFAKSWSRAIGCQFFITLVWSLVRIAATLVFPNEEEDVPLIGFVIVPFIYSFIAALLRLLRMTLLYFFRRYRRKDNERIFKNKNG